MTRLLRIPEVLARTGLSRSRLYADPTFPRSVKIGERAVAWVEDEISDWVAARIAERGKAA
jgi:prophage regulatory protein